jgi:hypothetical protein
VSVLVWWSGAVRLGRGKGRSDDRGADADADTDTDTDTDADADADADTDTSDGVARSRAAENRWERGSQTFPSLLTGIAVAEGRILSDNFPKLATPFPRSLTKDY